MDDIFSDFGGVKIYSFRVSKQVDQGYKEALANRYVLMCPKVNTPYCHSKCTFPLVAVFTFSLLFSPGPYLSFFFSR